jgi:hypothetical protein
VKLLAALFIIFTGTLAFATDLPEQTITVQQKNIGLRDLLTSLLEETNLKFKLSNNITNEKKLSVEVKEAKWSDVFQFVINEGNLNYRMTAKKRILVSP